MVTYQLGDWIKVSVHLREGLWGLDPCPSSRLTKLCPALILVSSKQKSEYNNFLNHKKVLEIEKHNLCENYFVLCFIIVLQSCDLVACVSVELCSKFLQDNVVTCQSFSLKRGALTCNNVAIKNTSAYSFYGKCLPEMVPM